VFKEPLEALSVVTSFLLMCPNHVLQFVNDPVSVKTEAILSDIAKAFIGSEAE
jgi:hypothetical protein